MLGLYRRNPRKPILEVSTNVFKITLPVMSDVELSEQLSKALGAFSDMPIGRTDLEEQMGISRMSALGIIKELLRLNLIAEVGSGRSTKYVRL